MSLLMPVLFVGHGSPMNTLGVNSYTGILSELGRNLPRPENILIISAHWQTDNLQIYSEENSKVIYDFNGFPEELYQINYPAPGSPFLTENLKHLLDEYKPSHDQQRGLDHGAWTVLRHLFPEAKIPVVQLSLKKKLSLREHFEIGKKLAPLRSKKTLIVASGNITHNLYQISWEKTPKPFDWAVQFDDQISQAIKAWDENTFLGQSNISSALWKQAHPTIDHYLPLLYALGSASNEKVTFFNDEIQNGSMSMKSLILGNI